MIQLLKLREFINKSGEKIKYDKFVDESLRIPSVKHLFMNLDNYLSFIPESERWNLFYTLANCGTEKREFSSSSTIAFDIDGTGADKDITQYITLASAVLGVAPGDITVVDSGNGIHLIFFLTSLIKSEKYYKDNKIYYNALCAKLTAAFKNAGLPGACDPAIFEPKRILRLPGTTNRKPGRPDTRARLIQIGENGVDLNLQALSGVPKVEKSHAIDEKYLKKLPKPNAAAIMEGCSFLGFVKDNAGLVSEPQWYAALSITGRFGDKHKTAHAISEGYKGYSYDETELKIKQATEVSGPRTCKGIAGLWDGCSSCPNFEKVKSPILLQGSDVAKSQASGFYNVVWKGDTPKFEPDYEGLVHYFDTVHPYFGYGDSRKVYTWNKTHYEPRANVWIEEFAMTHFDPVPKTDVAREFRSHVASTKLRSNDWWDESTRGFINLRNGVLNTETWEFLPHSPERGFRYCLPFDFDEAAECPMFDEFMDRITLENKELQDILDEFGGYTISGSPYIHPKILMLVGDGSNGKSTWINILTGLVGEDHIAAADLYDLQKDPYALASLDGKLLNISEEVNRRALNDSGMIKKLVSTGIHRAREPYGSTFYFRNRAKLITTCNQLPNNFDASHGMFRRLLIIPCEARFSPGDPGFDPMLETKIIEAELPGVFNRFLAGYKRLLKQGKFSTARASEETSAEYLELSKSSPVTWAEEHLQVCQESRKRGEGAQVTEMYELYKQWCEATGEDEKTLKYFSMHVVKLFRHAKVESVRIKEGERRDKRYFIGLKYMGETQKSI